MGHSRYARPGWTSWACSAVDDNTTSTGNSPGLGSAGGRKTGARMPVMPASFMFSSCSIGNTLRLRSVHGLSAIPPNPWVGKLIWKLCSNSGVSANAFPTSAEYVVTCSSVAFAGTSIAPNTKL